MKIRLHDDPEGWCLSIWYDADTTREIEQGEEAVQWFEERGVKLALILMGSAVYRISEAPLESNIVFETRIRWTGVLSGSS